MKKKVRINTLQGERPNTTIFVMSQDIRGLSTYESAKAITNFISRETNVLKTCVLNHLRQIVISNGIIPQDGTNQALERALHELEDNCGKRVEYYNRYVDTKETIIGENHDMTVINEDGILSCAIEIEVIENGW